MAGTFPTPDFNSSYTITHRNFVRISDKKFFRKNHEPLPSIKIAPGIITIYNWQCVALLFWFIHKKPKKHNMTMNIHTANQRQKIFRFLYFNALDNEFESFEKIFTTLFWFKRNSQKTKKTHIFASHINKCGLWPELSLRLSSTHPIQ
jgi:hypothetical protein